MRLRFSGTSRKSCRRSLSSAAPSATTAAVSDSMSKNARSWGIIHPLMPIPPPRRIAGTLGVFIKVAPGDDGTGRVEARSRLARVDARGLELLHELLPHLPGSGEA